MLAGSCLFVRSGFQWKTGCALWNDTEILHLGNQMGECERMIPAGSALHCGGCVLSLTVSAVDSSF